MAGDTNRFADIFVHEALSGLTERVSVSTSGQQANADSTNPAIDGHGRLTAFDSSADNLAPNDTNHVADVFVHDRTSDRTVRVSTAVGGGAGNASSFYPSISASGRFVAFVSDATDLIPGGTNGQRHIFVRDLQTRRTEVVSVASDGAMGNSSSATPSISAYGNIVVFASFATNLVPDDTNGLFDVFVRDRSAGTTVRASVATDGTEGNDDSTLPAVSGNGGFVAFKSDASNLVPDDTNGVGDVLLHAMATGSTIRVSVATNGAQANDASTDPAMLPGGARTIPP